MSFQAYIDNIYAKTGKTPQHFRAAAEAKGLINPDVKVMEMVNWLKNITARAMAIVLAFRQAGAIPWPRKP